MVKAGRKKKAQDAIEGEMPPVPTKVQAKVTKKNGE